MPLIEKQIHRSDRDLSRFIPTLVVLILSASVTGILLFLDEPWYWEQVPFHSLIEGLGGFVALTVATTLLILRGFSKDLSTYIWLASGLIGMGLLDCFHAMVMPGKEFVWLHSLSNFWGGLFFACVWLPERLSNHDRIELVPIFSFVAAILVGLFSLLMPEMLPSMKGDTGFTSTANFLNIAGGVGFISAALYFALLENDCRVEHSPVLLNHCLLFGVSGLLFGYSTLWDGVWWEWHFLRLVAYGFILYFFLLTYRSERHKAEEELRRLSQAVHYSGEAIMMTNAKGVIEYVNPAFTEITDYASEEVIGRDPSLLKSNAQNPEFYRELWQTISQGSVWSGTLIDRKKDGSFFPAMMSIAPIRNEDGSIVHYVSLIRDMTEHQRLENQFRQAQKMESIGTLVGGIAHDFNNMLAAIDGNLYLANQDMDKRDELEKRLESIQLLSNRAAGIVAQLLTYARKDMVAMEVFSLNAFMMENYDLSRSTVPENIEYGLEESNEQLKIQADATQLQQILMNLINNARYAVADKAQPAIASSVSRVTADDEFMQRHPHLQERNLARITIRDNGDGISKDIIEKIFEPFFTTKSVGQGTGLGLSMVYGSVQRHGGTIEVESEFGEGTAFHIFFPLIDAPDLEVSLQLVAEIWMGQGETILLVDDQVELLQTTSSVLKSLNYQVIEARDGEEALEKFMKGSQPISLLFTDIVMPKLGGVKLAEKIREQQPDLPIIFVTGYSRSNHDLPEEKGAQTILLSKPYSFTDVSHSIQSLLKKEKESGST